MGFVVDGPQYNNYSTISSTLCGQIVPQCVFDQLVKVVTTEQMAEIVTIQIGCKNHNDLQFRLWPLSE